MIQCRQPQYNIFQGYITIEKNSVEPQKYIVYFPYSASVSGGKEKRELQFKLHVPSLVEQGQQVSNFLYSDLYKLTMIPNEINS